MTTILINLTYIVLLCKINLVGLKINFTAIDVGRGDAFFMRKGDRTLLVDGGGALSFPRDFAKATGQQSVEVLVCTHSDSDHAKGVLGFLRRKGHNYDEVWLPASWMDRIVDLTLHPADFFTELIENLESRTSYDLEVEPYASEKSYEDEIVQVNAENINSAANICFSRHSQSKYYLIRRIIQKLASSSNQSGHMLSLLLSAGNLIREIFLAACRSGSSIRWFDYVGNHGTMAQGGEKDFLIPVNAIEVTQIRRRRRSAFDYLRLTMANQRSLVFMSPPSDGPGILFTSDSDLRFYQQIQWHNGMIITAPHHGSEDNAYAYERFTNEGPNMTDCAFVRSDGRYKNRPGQSFTTIGCRKYCTWCRGRKLPKQDVQLELSNNTWQPVGTRSCVCA